MRVIERQGSQGDEHFTEGEPDLEPPEELAVLEVDEDALLEEDLDNQVDLEDDVDEEILELSLDHLVHEGDDEEDDSGPNDQATASTPFPTVLVGAGGTIDAGDASELDDLEIEDLEDRAESLDRILREKLAGDEEAGDDLDEVVTGADAVTVPACGPDEFRVPFLLPRPQRHPAGRGVPVAL